MPDESFDWKTTVSSGVADLMAGMTESSIETSIDMSDFDVDLGDLNIESLSSDYDVDLGDYDLDLSEYEDLSSYFNDVTDVKGIIQDTVYNMLDNVTPGSVLDTVASNAVSTFTNIKSQANTAYNTVKSVISGFF